MTEDINTKKNLKIKRYSILKGENKRHYKLWQTLFFFLNLLNDAECQRSESPFTLWKYGVPHHIDGGDPCELSPSLLVMWMNWPRLKFSTLTGSLQPFTKLHWRLIFWRYKGFNIRKTRVIFIPRVALGLPSRVASLPATTNIIMFKYIMFKYEAVWLGRCLTQHLLSLRANCPEAWSLRGRPIWVRTKLSWRLVELVYIFRGYHGLLPHHLPKPYKVLTVPRHSFVFSHSSFLKTSYRLSPFKKNHTQSLQMYDFSIII